MLLYNTHIRKLESDNVLWRHSSGGFIATAAAAAAAEYSANREHRKRYRCSRGIGRRSREQRESNAWEFVKGPALAAAKLRLVLNCDLLTMAKFLIGVRSSSSSSSSSFYLPNSKTICTSTSIQFRRAGQQGPTRTLTAALKRLIQEAQLSPRDRAMRRVSWNLANCHATAEKLLVRQVLKKSKLWSWRVKVGRCVINMCTQPWRIRVAFIVL